MRTYILLAIIAITSFTINAQTGTVRATVTENGNLHQHVNRVVTDSTRPYPVNFSHFGVTVPDLDKAQIFYENVFGWYVVSGPIEVNESGDAPLSEVGQKIYGKGWKSFRFVHLVSADGIGFEIFEFANNDKSTTINTPFKTGFHHVALQTPNISELVQRIIANGGKQTTEILHLSPGPDGYKMVFTEDPFGNVMEIYSHGYAVQNKDLGK